jgi:hypothetical protein
MSNNIQSIAIVAAFIVGLGLVGGGSYFLSQALSHHVPSYLATLSEEGLKWGSIGTIGVGGAMAVGAASAFVYKIVKQVRAKRVKIQTINIEEPPKNNGSEGAGKKENNSNGSDPKGSTGPGSAPKVKGVPPKVIAVNNKMTTGERTALHRAAAVYPVPETIEGAKAILDKEPRLINTQDKNGFTPLHFAARNGNVALVKLLLQKGADLSIKNNAKKTPLELAQRSNTTNAKRCAEALSAHEQRLADKEMDNID